MNKRAFHSVFGMMLGGFSLLGCAVQPLDLDETWDAVGEGEFLLASPSAAVWEFVGNQPMPGNGADLTAVARYVATNGPCYGKAAGTCVFDSRTFVTAANGHQIESVTAYGRYYNWDVENGYQAWGSNGSLLTSVPRYANGPCVGHPICTFDTRSVSVISGIKVESVTAYGMYYNWNADTGAFLSSGNLHNIPRYALGACLGVPVGQCVFDTREIFMLNGVLTESITAGGYYWNYNALTGASLGSGSLSTVPRYSAPTGPCYGLPGGTCQFSTRATYMLNGQLVESITN